MDARGRNQQKEKMYPQEDNSVAEEPQNYSKISFEVLLNFKSDTIQVHWTCLLGKLLHPDCRKSVGAEAVDG